VSVEHSVLKASEGVIFRLEGFLCVEFISIKKASIMNQNLSCLLVVHLPIMRGEVCNTTTLGTYVSCNPRLLLLLIDFSRGKLVGAAEIP
jgi:hypothetical protein